jgi:branched-chain amino acid aminotransferase
MDKSDRIWMDGQLVPWDQATVHVAAHVIHYGSSVFEGIRAYEAAGRTAVFCLEEHLDRHYASCRVYRLEPPYARREMRQAILDTIQVNGHRSCYIRPVIYRGWGSLSVDGRDCPAHAAVITFEMGKYLGPDALEKGVDVGVSSWRRMAPDTYPAAAKLGGQYLNSQFVAMEAADHGYDEGIALDINGYVSEGSGENIFVVRRGELYTPPLAGSILDGITRRCVMTLAREQGLPAHQETIPRELLYVADELFFCGTAVEITPIRSVDGVMIGDGRRGPVTAGLMEAFFELVEGRTEDRHGWLTPVG